MLISSEQEYFSLPLENGVVSLNSSPPGSDQDGIVLPDSPQVLATFTDVNVVPEKENHQFEQTISNLEEEILGLKLKQRSLDDKRREALNKILDIKGCIRVFCRVRTFVSTDKRRTQQPISVESERIVVRSAGTRKEFVFDKVFPQEASQDEVFVEVEPILRSALDGHNVCVLAYGQTGTGKTYTMDGTSDSPGIVPRALEELFRQTSQDSAASYTFSISMIEVYLGHLRDLLAPRLSCRKFAVSRCNLNIQLDSKGSVEIEGLTEIPISNFTKASWWYNKGTRCRSTSWTNVNEASSRSHCLMRITINRFGNVSGGKPEVSKLWMVDLGGSERLLKTGATGKTLDEGRAINLSLSALGDVIAGLRRKRGHVPYRNSKLTQILRDSLGDASKALLLVHVSPYEEDAGETICSFTFAKRARGVEFNRELAEEVKKQKEKRVADLEEEMRVAEEECKKLKHQIEKVEFLLSKSKKLLEEQEKISISPKANLKEAPQFPQTSEKAIIQNATNSWPQFMNSTIASRQKQNSAEKQIDGRARILRSGTRSSVQISGSQSISYTDPRFKAFLRISSKKPRNGGTDMSHTEGAKCNGSDSKQPATPRGMIVSSSGLNFRVSRGHHRRRMSDLI